MTKPAPVTTTYHVAPVEHGRDAGTVKSPDAEPAKPAAKPKKQQAKKSPDTRPDTETPSQPKKKKK